MAKNNREDRKMKTEDKKLSMAVKRMLFYSDEEWDAVLNPEQMTRELFRACVETGIRIDDFETLAKLSEMFPEYFDEMMLEIKDENGSI